jgi:hypothetical protein
LNSLNLPSTPLVRDWFKPSYSEMNGIIGMTELALVHMADEALDRAK